jgi:hypothetical protein
MFSKLDPVSVPSQARKAESSDARMDIRRDESQTGGQKKGQQGDHAYTPIPWEDSAVVSTGGLKVFLQSLLQGATPQKQDSQTPNKTVEETITAAALPQDSRMGRAAQAYQTTGRAVHDRNIEDISPTPVPASAASETVALGSDFTEDDLKSLRQFIADLSELERRGITEIPVERSLSFLEGIRRAISSALRQTP